MSPAATFVKPNRARNDDAVQRLPMPGRVRKAPGSRSHPGETGHVTRDGHPMRYRPDIDGLRAVAVLSVVLFHAGVPGLTGGYVGVDIFFVISGYLITTILLQDQSIIRFYQRRARRILPALFAVLAVVLLLGTALMLPHDLTAMAKSAAATIAFLSNVWFWRQSDYFAIATELWPLLHTWSLGVEEQFYIVFPIVVRIARRLPRPWLAALFALLALLSFAMSVYGIQHVKTTLVFYLSPTRAWELLVGSILATGVLPSLRGRGLRSLLALAGLVAVVLPVFLYGRDTEFPGTMALPPVLGAAALIWAGTGGPTLVSPLLSARPMIFVGLISYSLYLWHWPVLAFARYVSVDPLPPLWIAGAIGAAFAAAVLSWRYVERPFRRHSLPDRTVWLFSLGGILLLGGASLAIIAAKGLPGRFPPALVALNEDSGTTWRCPVTRFVRFGDFYACRLNLPSGDPRDADVVLWGDSHAQMYAPALMTALGTRRGLLVNANGCAPVLGDAITPECGSVQRGNYALIRALPAGTVILAQNWPQYRDEAGARLGRDPLPAERYQDGIRRLREVVAGLRAAGKQVLLIGPIAIPGYDVASIAPRELRFHGRLRQPTSMTRQDYRAEYANVIDAEEQLARDPGVRLIRIDDAVCDAARCGFIRDGHAVFADYSHFTTPAAERLAPVFAEALADIPAVGR